MSAEPVPAKVRKFPCAACGAAIVWSPGRSALECPYCGAKRELPASADVVRERPIEEGLARPAALGWGAERKAVSCPRCGATSTRDPGQAAGSCPFCGTAEVVEAPASNAMVRPEGLLPFAIARDAAATGFRAWLSRLWLRPSDLKSTAALTALRGVYVPFWTFDALTHSAWTAEAGYNYEVSVDAVENGQHVTRSETRTRWEPASGLLEKAFDDVPVPASRGIPPPLARGIEPFPTAGLVPYEPAYLAGFLAEENAVPLAEALAAARERMDAEIRDACAREIPGDTYRDLAVRTEYSGVAYKNGLLPVWIAAYRYGAKAYRYLVNGVTGRATGTAPFSPVKIALVVLAAIVFLILLATLKR
ncbi:MAG TPA: zinc ribbon domain-containing protein [Thermoanaerobaculia bacterium]|nr:zinc ribbon domain-containing protein [Thermoanaerobaculia bacterium]